MMGRNEQEEQLDLTNKGNKTGGVQSMLPQNLLLLFYIKGP